MADPTQGLPAYNPPLGLNAANALADQQYARVVAPGPGALAAVRGFAPSGFPVAQPGQGGTVAGLWQQALAANGAQAGVPQPQPVAPRMMGTADPTIGYPNFTNGAGAPAGFSPAASVNAVQPVSAQPTSIAAPTVAPSAAFAPSPERLARAGLGADGGQLVNLPSAGTPPAANLPAYGGGGGGGGLTNPSGAIANGYEQQLSYQRNALAAIMGAAQQGSAGNYSYRLGHLVGAMGQNNFASVQGQGADALNQSMASEANAAMSANASMYGADVGLARTGEEVGEQHYQAATSSVPLGTTVGTDPVTHMAVPLTTYGQRPATVGGMPSAYNTAAPAARPKEGATGKTPEGTPTVYRNGTWVAQ